MVALSLSHIRTHPSQPAFIILCILKCVAECVFVCNEKASRTPAVVAATAVPSPQHSSCSSVGLPRNVFFFRRYGLYLFCSYYNFSICDCVLCVRAELCVDNVRIHLCAYDDMSESLVAVAYCIRDISGQQQPGYYIHIIHNIILIQ